MRELTSVEPARFRNDTLTTVTVIGKGLNDVPAVALSSAKKVMLRQGYHVSLSASGTTSFETTEVRRTPPDRLEFDVLPGITPGTYDVRVQPPLGAALVLPHALTIFSESELDGGVNTDAAEGGRDASRALGDFVLLLEDAPGGMGTQLDPEKLHIAGEQLDCYAVVRSKDGAYEQDTTVAWTVSDAAGVTLSEPARGPNAQVTRATPGELTITATSETYGSASVTAHFVGGPAVRLTLSPESALLKAGDPTLSFSVSAQDAAGNATESYGDLTFSLADGTLTGFDAAAATLTPKLIGAGHVLVKSSLGIEAKSGLIEVAPGPLTRLFVLPDTLQLSADDAPVQFVVSGVDAFNNVSDQLGDLTWTVGSGPISSLSNTGLLDPVKAGTGTIRVSSSLGVTGSSGNIEIRAGRAAALSVTPSTWHGIVGGATQQFATTATDADGNITTDVGTLSYTATGPISGINGTSGLFTPTTAGQGTVKATSSYGVSTSTQNLVVSSPSATVSITAMRLGTIFQGATTRLELDVTTNDVADALLTGFAFTFANNNSIDITSDYTVFSDYSNSDHVVPGSKLTLVYYVAVSSSTTYNNFVLVSVKADAFNSANVPVAVSTSGAVLQYPADVGTALRIDDPKPPADRICAGGRVAFSATVSNTFFGYLWAFPDGKLAANSHADDQSPSVDFSSPGVKSYSVTAQLTWFGVNYATTLPSILMPVFVGTSSSSGPDSYPTGRVVFSTPSANQGVGLSSLPRSNLIALDPSYPVRQCNNQAVDVTGHNKLTLFSDRKLIDPAADSDPATPGIQLPLTVQAGLPSVPLLAAASQVEGPTTFYAEYFDAQRGVTAAGDVTFNLTADTQAPSLRFSLPASDCSTACLKSKDPLVFQFSEPLASIGPVLVELYSAASTCTGSPSDWTNNTTLRYDAAESALYVTTPMRAPPYSVRIRLPATLTDTASAKNPLPAQSRCVVFGALADVSTPVTPQLTAAVPSVFSPDGDQLADDITWNIAVDASTTLLRLRVLRSGKAVWGKLVPVSQAGTYSITWDGTDPAGRVVNNGAYAYSIEALNRAGTTSTALRGVLEVSSAVRLVTLRRRQ